MPSSVERFLPSIIFLCHSLSLSNYKRATNTTTPLNFSSKQRRYYGNGFVEFSLLFIFVSGFVDLLKLGFNFIGKFVSDSVEDQTKQVLKNMREI
ncbi:hypothetical protein Leryth_023830 [Lithospermum erythrorhizon]|nr:hypothetical protein Leryth_023830 [Lithospermum erythrorhizon]